MKKNLAPLKEMCATCPFRDGSTTAFLREAISHSAITEANRICHSTGSNNAFHRRTGKPERGCRGARDYQLKVYHALGVLEAPTDEAWADACRKQGIKPPS